MKLLDRLMARITDDPDVQSAGKFAVVFVTAAGCMILAIMIIVYFIIEPLSKVKP